MDQSAGLNVFSFIILALMLGVTVAIVAALWKVFAKAGKPGWACLIPIYNVIVLLQIIGRPWWYVIFLFIPGANIVLGVILAFGTARSFGQGWPFAIGIVLLPFVFIPILGFGGARYIGGMGPSYRRGPAMPARP